VVLSIEQGKEERSGSAFEYAFIAALSRRIHVNPIENVALARAKQKYETSTHRNHFLKCAESAVEYIAKIDLRIVNSEPKKLFLNSSRAAQSNHDVRDVVLQGSTHTIGFSCKVNNQDLRHSRLSKSIDFVREWGLDSSGASRAYWKSVEPVFGKLHQLRERGLDWIEEYPSLASRRRHVLAPVLDAWALEIDRVASSDSTVPEKLCRYLLGSKSYWKVISNRGNVLVQNFNLEGDMPGKTLAMPSKFLGISIREKSSVRERVVAFGGEYSFGFRLHTASSHIENSLKFAVKGLTLPGEIKTVKIPIRDR
jgi:hypothetical protein